MKDAPISVFKDLYKSTDVPFIIPLQKSLERIRVGKSKDLIEKIRRGDKNLKQNLPCILFAGEFRERKGSSLQKHSGLMITDFDKFPSEQEMNDCFETLKANPHFVAIFVSPSGKGLKGVVRIPETDKENHPKYFKAFQKEYQYDYFDMANSDVNRVCFESYDPNIYINYDAQVFEPVIEDEGFDVTTRVPMIPITNEDMIIDRIMKWSWTKDFREGERNAFIFDLAGAFCEYGVSQTTAEGYILNNVVIGDFPEREAKTAINSAYKTRRPNTKYFEDYSKIGRIKKDLKDGKREVIEKHNITEDTYNSIKEEQEHEDFWYYDKKDNVKIDNLKYKFFLERNGFKKYFPEGSNKPTWVSISSNIVSETSVEKLKDFVLNYLLDNGELEVWKLCSNYANLFSESFLLMLDSIELKMLKDKKHKSFIAFQNGILEITKDKAELIEYIDIDGYVWESQIIKRDYVNIETTENDYQKFIGHVSHDEPLALECAIGYLLSTYKNKMNNKAIILNDEEISDNPEGGTGKGLLVQGLKQVRRVSILDGKSFDDKKSFPYQTVSQDTQILVFDDVVKNFNFENKFSLVTEGITIERKNKDAIKLSVEDSPKMLISTNYAIRGEGNSHDRRRHELEIAQYYGKDRTPFDEFGHQLFDDWDDEEFLKFDNYMVSCLQAYLKHGLVKQNAKNLVKRKFIMETGMEFNEWVEDENNFPLNSRRDKQETFDNFVNEYQDFKKWLSRKRFNIWIEKYANFIGAEYKTGNSNGSRWFMIQTTTEAEVAEELDEIEF